MLVSFRSSLLVAIIFKCTKHYNYLQAYLQQTQTFLQALNLLKTHLNKQKSYKNVQLIIVWCSIKTVCCSGPD
jgi:hypothetical protein